MLSQALILSALLAPALASTHSNITQPFWDGYTYCLGRTLDASTYSPMKDAELIKLQVLHRHGARSTALAIPTDNTPWYQCDAPAEFMTMNNGDTLNNGRSVPMHEKIVIDGPYNSTMWGGAGGNCDLGQNTNLGSANQKTLGHKLREVYVDGLKFLPSHLQSQHVKLSHTYIWRTRESVENLMGGLYPNGYRAADQTVVVSTKPSALEIMITNTASCPKMAALVTNFSSSATYAGIMANYSALSAKFVAAYNTSHISGYNTSTAVATLYDGASAAYCHGLGLKGSLTADDIQTAVTPGTASYHELFRSNPQADLAKALSVGPWLAQIVASFSDLDNKLEIYSAHDASLDMFLGVVADPDLPWPSFSANIEIELWNHSTKGKVVRMFYEGMIVPNHPKLACSFDACPLSTLESFLQGYIPANQKVACAL